MPRLGDFYALDGPPIMTCTVTIPTINAVLLPAASAAAIGGAVHFATSIVAATVFSPMVTMALSPPPLTPFVPHGKERWASVIYLQRRESYVGRTCESQEDLRCCLRELNTLGPKGKKTAARMKREDVRGKPINTKLSRSLIIPFMHGLDHGSRIES